MAPLVHHADVARLIPRLNPRFEIGGDVYVLMTQFIGAVPLKDLGERLIDLSHRSDDITAATDFLFQGFKHQMTPWPKPRGHNPSHYGLITAPVSYPERREPVQAARA
ncbi:CcdB family protein [Rhizobium rhizoryzae]|uniref:CcdB family protein n=1 Tax=Rhizobium rhizoryzae TaxID=451876 RepID=UPI001FE448D6|nr:CcdB family protein [Rhizobium rhizoryzae]